MGEWEIVHHHSSRQESTGADDYYMHFFKSQTKKSIKEETRVIAPDYFLSSGLFSFEDSFDEYKLKILARHSIIWRRDNNDKLGLIHHHMSAKPD